MRLHGDVNGTPVWHDCRTGFGEMLRLTLSDHDVIAAHGPIYVDDPAASLFEPFQRSARETGWICDEATLAPSSFLERARKLRDDALSMASGLDSIRVDLVDWARAGLVLEIARRRGVRVKGRGLMQPTWRLRGTVTGRFGCDPVRGENPDGTTWVFNPLSLGPDDRPRIVPSDAVREIAVLDFRGMDVCSMISIVPGLAEVYDGHPDPHQRTAELTGLSRANAKQGFLSWAYGASFAAQPDVGRAFDATFPSIRSFTRGLAFGDFPRMVQMTSAVAFRSALSRALPLLVGERYIPMFVVHDELTVDVSPVGLDKIDALVSVLEQGARDRIGVRYHVGISTGYTYEEAKHGH